MRTIEGYSGLRVQENTATLLSRVLGITTGGFLLTALGAYLAPDILSGVGFFAIVICTFGLVIGISAMRKSPGIALTMFGILSLLMGVEISPVINSYLHMANGQQVVFESALTTAVGLGVLALVSQAVSFDYRKVGAYAMAGVLGLIVVGVLSMFVSFIHPGVYAWMTLLIFSVLVLVDFKRIQQGGDGASAVQLALSIYLDAINIFMALLQIFGGRRDRR